MMLTAVSTVLGLIPIAPTVFWGPMAFAIMGGLLVATLLTLVFLPTLYVTVYGARAPARVRAAVPAGAQAAPTSRSWLSLLPVAAVLGLLPLALWTLVRARGMAAVLGFAGCGLVLALAWLARGAPRWRWRRSSARPSPRGSLAARRGCRERRSWSTRRTGRRRRCAG